VGSAPGRRKVPLPGYPLEERLPTIERNGYGEMPLTVAALDLAIGYRALRSSRPLSLPMRSRTSWIRTRIAFAAAWGLPAMMASAIFL
jgi:hypothetical protein